jgi:hypothetical protein
VPWGVDAHHPQPCLPGYEAPSKLQIRPVTDHAGCEPYADIYALDGYKNNHPLYKSTTLHPQRSLYYDTQELRLHHFSAEVWAQGSAVAFSLCTTAHPHHARFHETFGTSEATMRPNPRWTVRAGRRRTRRLSDGTSTPTSPTTVRSFPPPDSFLLQHSPVQPPWNAPDPGSPAAEGRARAQAARARSRTTTTRSTAGTASTPARLDGGPPCHSALPSSVPITSTLRIKHNGARENDSAPPV